MEPRIILCSRGESGSLLCSSSSTMENDCVKGSHAFLLYFLSHTQSGFGFFRAFVSLSPSKSQRVGVVGGVIDLSLCVLSEILRVLTIVAKRVSSTT